MSPLHLFDRQQDFAYQQEVAATRRSGTTCGSGAAPRAGGCPAGYPVDWLAAGTLRPQRRPLADDLPGHPQDRRGHRRRAGPPRRQPDRGRPGRGGRGDPELLQRLPRPQRRWRRDRDRRRPARGRPPAGRAADRPGRRDAHGQPRPAAGADRLRGRGRRRPRGWSTCCSRCPWHSPRTPATSCRRCTARPRPARRSSSRFSECWTSGSAWPPSSGATGPGWC